MSVYFTHEGRYIWNPARRVGVLYVDQVQAVEKLLGGPSGITDTQMDEYTIDQPAFGAFVDTLIKRIGESEHDGLIVLTRGWQHSPWPYTYA